MSLAAVIALLQGFNITASEGFTDAAQVVERLQSREGGTVKLAFDGVVVLSETLLITTNTTVDASGYSVTFDGANNVRHFVVTNGARLRLLHLKLVNGRSLGGDGQTNSPGTAARGGAILNSGGTLELVDCVLTNNEAIGANGGPGDPNSSGVFQGGMWGGSAYGGAIYSVNGRLSITNCLFSSNTASGGLGAIGNDGYTGGGGDSFGGAIYSTNGESILVGVTFTNNMAKAGGMSGGRPLFGGGGAFGGALADESDAITVDGCVFIGNQALGATKVGSDSSRETGIAKGGALFHGSGTMHLNNTFLEQNSARGGIGSERGGREIIFGDGKGGAVYSGGDLEIRNSALVSNKASGGNIPPDCCSPLIAQAGTGEGGAVANDGLLTTINCTFADNSAAGGQSVSVGAFSGPAYGGAISVATGAISLLNVTLAGNRAEAVNPRKAFGSALSILAGTAASTNTIIFSLPGQTNVSGAIIDGGHNICSDESAHFTLLSSRNNLDPLLGPLTDNGGFTPTMMPLPSSPAIDQGDDSVCPTKDQRGFSRPMGLACDIGALELAPSLTMTRSAEGVVRLTHVFRAEQSHGISASTNLLEWVPLGTAASDTNGVFQFDDSAAAELPMRFYRVQTSPSSN